MYISTMGYHLPRRNIRLLRLLVALGLFVEPSLSQPSPIKVSDLTAVCAIDCAIFETKLPTDLCSAFIVYSNNSFVTAENIPTIRCNLPLVYVINDITCADMRSNITPEKVEEFVTQISAIITQFKVNAIVFDNIYPDTTLGPDTTWTTDVTSFFEKMKKKKACELYGLALPTSKEELNAEGVDVTKLNKVVDLYIATTFTCTDKTDVSKTATVKELEETLDTLTTNGYNLGNVIAKIRILNPVVDPSPELSCNFVQLDRYSIYCRAAIENLYNQAAMIKNKNVGGVVIQSVDHDEMDSICGQFPVVTVIVFGFRQVDALKGLVALKTSCLSQNENNDNSTTPSSTDSTTTASSTDSTTTPSSTNSSSTPASGGKLSVLRRICSIANAESKLSELPPDNLCTSFMGYSTNNATMRKTIDLPTLSYKLVMVINDYSYPDIRDQMKDINSDDFALTMIKIVDESKLAAIAFDNLFPPPDENDSFYVKDITRLFETLKKKRPEILFGVTVPGDRAMITREDIDATIYNKIFDFYLVKSYSYNQCKVQNEQALMAITSPVDGIRETFEALKTAKFNLDKCIAVMYLSINVIIGDQKVTDGKNDISYSELCSCMPKSEKFCKDSLSNFFKKGTLIKEYGIYGICFLYLDRDDYTGSCDCANKMYPILQAIEAGTYGGPKPVEKLKCKTLDSIPAPQDTDT